MSTDIDEKLLLSLNNFTQRYPTLAKHLAFAHQNDHCSVEQLPFLNEISTISMTAKFLFAHNMTVHSPYKKANLKKALKIDRFCQ